MKSILTSLLAIVAISAFSQSTWKKTLSADSTEMIIDVVATSYGYAMTGHSNSFGAGKNDILIMATDNDGNVLWSKVFGNGEDQEGLRIVEANDGGLMILGETNSLDSTGRDIVLIKLDDNGDFEWSKSYEGIRGEYAAGIFSINDGYVIAGYTWSFGTAADYLAMVINNSGEIVMANHFDGGNFETCFGATLVEDGMVMVGSRSVISTDNAFVIKIDTTASLVWAKEYGGNGVDQANSVVETTDGGYVFSGSTQSFGNGLLDFLMVKVDGNGSHVWTRALGGPWWEAAYSIVNNGDGFLIAGEGNTGDFHIFSTDAQGIYNWERVYDDNSWARAFSITHTDDDGFLLTGLSDRSQVGEAVDIFMVKSSLSGYNCSGNDSADAVISAMSVTTSDVVVTTGQANLNVEQISFTESDAIFSNNVDCESTPVAIEQLGEPSASLEVHPNPSNGLINIRLANSEKELQLKVYDIKGGLVLTSSIKGNGHQVNETVNITDLPKGLYNLNVSGRSTNYNERIIIQ